MKNNQKQFSKSISIILCLILLLATMISCGAGSQENANNDTEELPQTDCVETYPTVYEYYSLDRKGEEAFAKLSVNKIYDGEYKGGIYSDTRCVLVECTVIQDYYNRFERECIINIPIYLNQDDTRADVERFLEQCDNIYVYVLDYCDQVYSITNNETVNLTNVVGVQHMSYYSIIPIVNGTVNLNLIDDFLGETSYLHYTDIYGFSDVIENNSKEEILSSNISKMYEYLLSQNN